MYYLGMLPTADKRLYCPALRGAQGKSGQAEKRAWPRNCSQAPAPVRVGFLAELSSDELSMLLDDMLFGKPYPLLFALLSSHVEDSAMLHPRHHPLFVSHSDSAWHADNADFLGTKYWESIA
ncbi:unnamed protein product [Pleuronectes platessa]|uniref:Uncharacterized protein n=1 Tax=Pleuronectes platessa TaxID=8262 RepID=A0A9N7VYN4_PLEPL|nr:unnamed protein product [Pleuronectes platessa]